MTSSRLLSAELVLSAACAVADDAALAALLDGLAADMSLDWDRIVPMAIYHGVEQLVHSRLEQLRPGTVPSGVARDIHVRAIRAAALQASQAQMACQVVQGLEQGGVPALVIKGAGVGHLLYAPHPEFRGSYDVDVLVAADSMPAAERVLKDMGLARTWPDFDVADALQPMLLKLANVVDFRDPRVNTTVELHARPTTNPHAFPVPFAALHAASVLVDTAFGPLRTLDGPANVAYLCHHALNSMVFRLKWFGDIARAERRAGMPCDQYVSASTLTLPKLAVRQAGEVLRRIEAEAGTWSSNFPVRDRPTRGLHHILGSMQARTHVPVERSLGRLPVEIANFRFTQRLQPGLRAKAYDLLLFASDPRDVMTLRLGPRFAPIYALAGPLLSLARFAGLARRG